MYVHVILLHLRSAHKYQQNVKYIQVDPKIS